MPAEDMPPMQPMPMQPTPIQHVDAKVKVGHFNMRPTLAETFKASKIKTLMQEIMTDKLQGKTYNAEDAGKWTREIADAVNGAVKESVEMPRYKHIVQVTMGQQLGAGCRYIAKCCWDAESDSQTSELFCNTSLFCVCTVFGVYLY